MEYVVQAIKVSENLMNGDRNAGTSNTGRFLPFSFFLYLGVMYSDENVCDVTKVYIHTGRGKKKCLA